MDGVDEAPEVAFMAAPLARVSLPTFSPFLCPVPRRLSSCFSEPSPALPAARKKLAWVSLQGRLVGAEEAASARAIGGGLTSEEVVAWELFTPMQRVLLIAVVAAASAESKKARRIAQLQKSVDIRDQVLLDMQQKLDDLCEQMNLLNDQSRDGGGKLSAMNYGSSWDEQLEAEGLKSHSCDHRVFRSGTQSGVISPETISSNEKKVISRTDSRKGDTFFISSIAEPEERRMSDLSDFCSSVTSSMDIQFSSLAAEQDYYNLHKECEEKDEIIKELTASSHASIVASSKRITELEDIVRRKNMIITKLKKDMVVLEQKVIQLTRQQRPSFVASNSNDSKIPVMSNNLLYDMSSSSPSSSDSDCPTEKSEQEINRPFPHPQVKCESSENESPTTIESARTSPSKNSISWSRSMVRQQQRSRSPLKENCLNHSVDPDSTLRPRQVASSEGDPKRMRRRLHQEPKRTLPPRRWV